MKLPISLTLCALSLLIFGTACGGSSSTPPPPPAPAPASVGPSIYVAGVYNNGTTDMACYWKDGVRVDLSTERSSARGIFVDTDGTVYTAGQHYLGSTPVACYWKGTTMVDLPDPGYSNSTARGIWVANGVVYTVGRYLYNATTHAACYWVGAATAQPLANSISMTEGIANSIRVSKGDFYIAGERSNGTRVVGTRWHVYQSGGTGIQDMTDSGVKSSANSIFIENDAVFLGGMDGNDACYWDLDGKRNLIAKDATCYGLFVVNGDVYSAGSLRILPNGPNTWKTIGLVSTNTPLAHGNDPVHNADEARAVFVAKGIVYSAGYSYDAGLSNYRACYWVGAKRTDLPVGSGGSSAHAIFVK